MSCTKSFCNGRLALFSGENGEFWKCFKCGHTISRLCACGGLRGITSYNGQSVAQCTKCKKYRY